MAAPAGAQTQPQAQGQAAAADSGTMKRADKDMRQVLDKLQSLGAKPIGTQSVEETRKGPTPADAVKAVLKDEGKDPDKLMAQMGVSKKDIAYTGPSGDMPARVYTPSGTAPQGGWPIVVYYHGGGWVIADLDTYEASAMGLAKQANAIVVSVEYRHAPENKFPAAHEDAITAYSWVLRNAGSFGGDPTRVALAGESAGGNLAINVAIAARQGNFQKPAHMLLIYPVAGTDLNTPSYKENANAMPLSKQGMEWFVQNATNGASDLQDPRLDVVGKADLKGLPPATVITAEIDPLRSEGKALADKLKSAGVDVTYRDFDGVTHEFFGMAPVVADAEKAQAFAGKELKEALAKGSATGSTSGGATKKQ
ncbi:alpha/beta hydrolase [Salinarimonas soli]|uniref:Alpha/beta hydrolase n=2 Tax=Salinarimonas soli TaxID=1638099 RepID=A0A5B2VA74_9HYPH|nr:alpha/beta hydrolase [Salinarimonas soli]